jgi:hypothetical protein
MKILFNLGVFGKHGVEHSLINILPQLRVPNSQIYLHEIYEPDYPSPLLEKIKDFTVHICSLPRHSFQAVEILFSFTQSIAFKIASGVAGELRGTD